MKLADVAPTVSAFYRVFFGFIFLLIICLFRGELRLIRVKTLAWIGLCGLLFALDLYCWHASILYIGPGLATILGNFQVFVLAAVGILILGERIRPRFLAAIPIAITGLVLLVGARWSDLPPEYQKGFSLGLMTAVCYSGFLLILRKLQGEGAPFSFFFNLMLISLVTACFLGGKMGLAGEPFSIPDLTSLTALLCLGFFSQTLGWALIANAMPKIPSSLTGLILLLQPALAFVWDVLFFQRPTSLVNWTGALVTLVAIYLGMTGHIKHK